MLKVQCPKCQAAYRLPADKAGKTLAITCKTPHCGQVFQVTLPMPEPPPVPDPAPFLAKEPTLEALNADKNETPKSPGIFQRRVWLRVEAQADLHIPAQEFLLAEGKNLVGRHDEGMKVTEQDGQVQVQQKGKKPKTAARYHRIRTGDQADGQFRSGLSRLHCCIEARTHKNGQPEFLLYDCGALLPIRLNDDPNALHPLDRVYLQHDDLLCLGAVRVRFFMELGGEVTPEVVRRR